MNILLVNHYAGSRALGMEYRPYYLARQWVAQGHRVTVAAASFSHLRRGPVDCEGAVREEHIDGIRYVWLRAPAYSGNGLGRFRNMLTFLYRLYRHRRSVAGDAPPDVVIASSTYPLDIYPARRIALKHGAALVFEVHDLWPLSPIELGGMPRWHPFILAMQRAEDFACRHADRIVSILPKADRHLVTRGMAPEKFSHVPNGIEVAEWEQPDRALPEEHARAIAGQKARGRFLVGYAGAHGLSNALGVLIEAAAKLRNDPVGFLLVGRGPAKAELQRAVRAKGLENVVFLPAVAKQTVPALLARMDGLYVGWPRRSLYRFGISPNKVFEYMMAARPVVHSVTAANDMVAESGCGISVAAEDPQAVAGAVRSLMATSPEQRAAMGRRGREYVLENHDYRHLAGRFLDAIRMESDSTSRGRRAAA